MDGSGRASGPRLSPEAIGRLMPMSLWLSGDGEILAAGPTLEKLAGRPLAGCPFDAHFVLERPAGPDGIGAVARHAGRRLNLRLKGAEGGRFRGIAVPVGEGADLLLNMSFGISAAQAVGRFGLTAADFAPTDLTVELLYLTEVKAAVVGELAALNGRIEGARAMAESFALTDALTGLANRRAFDAALDRAIAGARRGTPFALMHLDLDRFKAVNDTHGHAAGDAILRAVAGVLRAVTRAADTGARLGGDEFTLILPLPGGPDDLLALGARIIAGIERPVDFDGVALNVSASIGAVVSSDYAAPSAHQLLSDADAALYASKRAGRGRTSLFRAQT